MATGASNVCLRLGPASADLAREVVAAELAPLLRAGRGREALWLVRGDLRRRRIRAAALAACGGAAFDLPFATLEAHVRSRYHALPAHRRLISAVERRVLLEGVLPQGAWLGHVERLGRFLA